MTSPRWKRIEKRSQKALGALNNEIGSLARGFSLLEEEVVSLFSLLVSHGDGEVGRIISKRLNFSQLISMIADLSEAKLNQQSRKSLNAILEKLRAASRIRNDSVHSCWGYLMTDDHTMCQWSRKRGSQREQR